jgi:hypothetical protein
MGGGKNAVAAGDLLHQLFLEALAYRVFGDATLELRMSGQQVIFVKLRRGAFKGSVLVV